MKVILKEPYEAEQFNPKNGIPNCVADVLRSPELGAMKALGYEWAVVHPDNRLTGINIGDWIVNDRFVFTNEQFKQIFKEAVR